MSNQNSAGHSIAKALAIIAIWGACLAIVAITLPYVAKGDGEAICLVVFLAGLAAFAGTCVTLSLW